MKQYLGVAMNHAPRLADDGFEAGMELVIHTMETDYVATLKESGTEVSLDKVPRAEPLRFYTTAAGARELAAGLIELADAAEKELAAAVRRAAKASKKSRQPDLPLEPTEAKEG